MQVFAARILVNSISFLDLKMKVETYNFYHAHPHELRAASIHMREKNFKQRVRVKKLARNISFF